MPETLHPDVFTEERASAPIITGASTSTTGFVGTAKQGPTDKLGFVSSFREFEALYGTAYPDSFLEDALYGFFLNGGRRAFIDRIVGTGALKSSVNLPALAGAPSAAQIDGTNATPFNLEPGDLITIEVDGGAGQTFTFLATRAIRIAGGAAAPPTLVGTTLLVNFDGTGVQTVTFAGTESTADLIAAAINAQVTGGRCVNVAGTLQLESDTRGTGSSVNVGAGSTALATTGFTAGTTTGTGNVVNIDAVTIAEVLTVTAGLAGAVTSSNGGKLRITHLTPGLAFTLEVTAAAAPFGLPAGVVTGANSTAVSLLKVSALNVGAWGDTISATTTRWKVTTTAILSTGGTSIALTDVSKAEIGDVVRITDGVTAVNVHVWDVDIALKTIKFKAVTLGAPIASGATAATASSHRARGKLKVASLAADTVLKLVSASTFRVGQEISVDNGTNLTFRKITNVNGSELTLDAAIGFAFAIGVAVTSQSVNLTVAVDNQIDRTHAFLSLEDDDTQDWVEQRLLGKTNKSLRIEVEDLNPVIALVLEDRPAPVENVFLIGGNNGATPGDADYIAGLAFFEQLSAGQVNILAIPGITTTAVQQALSDFADSKANIVALIDGPLSSDEPLEIRDWRLNDHNRDTSYSALYYPWLTITDRHASGTGATKDVPPSGFLAGIYAQVDAAIGVWEPPGNRALRGVRDVVRRVTDGEQDLLNNIGVNVIRVFEGEGVRVWGIRTLSSLTDGRHYVHIRRLLNFDKISISRSLRRYIFKGIQPSLFDAIERDVESFHRTIWLRGGLFPSNSFTQAQFVKCDEENNPLDTRRLGQLFVDSGINPPFPAEFVIFRIGLFDGSQSVEEIIRQ